MLKLIIIPIWCSLMTLAGYVGVGLMSSEENSVEVVTETLVDTRTDTLSIAFIRNGSIDGHIATRVKYRLPAQYSNNDLIPLNRIVEHALTKAVNALPVNKISKVKLSDVAVLQNLLAEQLNKDSHYSYIQDVELVHTRLLLK